MNSFALIIEQWTSKQLITMKWGMMNSSTPRKLPVLTLLYGAMCFVINELIGKLSMSMTNLRRKKAVILHIMTSYSLLPLKC